MAFSVIEKGGNLAIIQSQAPAQPGLGVTSRKSLISDGKTIDLFTRRPCGPTVRPNLCWTAFRRRQKREFGMSKDVHYAREAALAESRNRQQIALHAAAMTLGGFKGDALSAAAERFASADHAEHDVTGVEQTLSENQLPSAGNFPKQQLYAVARRLDPEAFKNEEE